MLYCVPKGRIAFHRGENTNGGKRMNIFDIVGPIMVGPSSSHTAGAVRIGYITRRLLGEAGHSGGDWPVRILSGNR